MSTDAGYEVISEDPGGSHARASMIPNVWVVRCNNCGTYDIVGPGHPAVRDRGDGTHEYFDRTALRHQHADDCLPNEEGNYSHDHSFMIQPPALAAPPRRLGPVAGLITTQLLMLRAFAVWRLSLALAGMTDQTLVTTLLKNLLSTTATATWAPTGGTSLTILPPILLRLYKTTGTESATGTELTGAGTDSGYTNGTGLTMGSVAFALASAVATQSNQVQWTATGTWTEAVNGIECWDSSATKVRILWGALTAAIAASTVLSTDTVTFAASAITATATTW